MTTFRYVTVIFAIIFGVGATVWGFSEMQSFHSSPLAWEALRRFAPLVIIGATIVGLLSRWLKINLLATGVVLIGAIAVSTGTIWPLLVTTWIAAASYALGGTILSLLKLGADEFSCTTTGLIGVLIYGTAIGLLAHWPVNYPGVYGILLAAPLLWRWRSVTGLIGSAGQRWRSCADFKWHDTTSVLVALVQL